MTGGPSAAHRDCPFPGLRPFRRGEDPLFFGRAQEIGELRSALLGERRFVAVVGSSGCGKSSLIEAGLLPRLLADGVSEGRPWHVLALRPMGAPIAELADALADFAKSEQSEALSGLDRSVLASRFRATLRRTTDGLAGVISSIVPNPAARVLVFIDQFEELFRYEPDEADEDLPLFRDEAQTFTNLLLQAIQSPSPPIHVLAAMRSDFFGECGRYRGLAEAVSASQFLVPRMVREQLQEAITGPLCVAAGIAPERWPEVLEPALLQRLLNAVGADATADPLPVMQHALMRAWQMAELRPREDTRPTPVLRVADYEAAGEISEALSQHADQVLSGATAAAGTSLPHDGIAHLFRALTDIDREGRAIRRPQTLADLAPVVGAPIAAVRPVIDAFRAPGVSFLTPYAPAEITETTPIDISHEALIRQWKKIADASVDEATGHARGWLQQEFRDGLTWRALAVQARLFGSNPEACLDPATTAQHYRWFRVLRRRPAWALRYAIRLEPKAAPADQPEWHEVWALLLASLKRKHAEQHAQRAAIREANLRTAAALKQRRNALLVSVAAVFLGLSAAVLGLMAWNARIVAVNAEAQANRSLAAEVSAKDAARLALEAEVELHKQADIMSEKANIARKDADSARDGALSALKDKKRAESHLLADIAGGMPHVDSGTALALAIEALPDARSKSERPYVPEGENALSAAWRGLHERAVLAGDAGASVKSAAFSPDGRRIITASADNTLRVRDADTGMPIGEPLRGDSNNVIGVAFSHDGKRMITTSDEGSAQEWGWDAGSQTFSPIVALKDRVGGVVISVGFSPDDARIVTLSSGKAAANGAKDADEDRPLTVQVWAAETGKPIGGPLGGPLSRVGVRSAVVSSDATRIVTLSDDRSSDAKSLTNGRREADQNRNSKVQVWSVETGQQIGQPLAVHKGRVRTVAFSLDGNRIVSAFDDTTVWVWVWDARAKIFRHSGEPLAGHDGPVSSAAFSPDATRIVTASVDKTARLWNSRTGEQIGEPLAGHDGAVISAAFSPDGKRIVTVSDDGTARVWDAQPSRAIGEPLRGHDAAVYGAVFSPDPEGRRVVTASGDKTVRVWVWDVNAKAFRQDGEPLKGHTSDVNSVAFSSDGMHIVTASDDKTARVWAWDATAKTFKSIAELKGHDDKVLSAAFSFDGKRIVTASADNTALVWDAETGKQVGQPLAGHTDTVYTAAFSRNGTRIVTASEDGTARLWDAQTGMQIGEPLAGHKGAVWSAAFSPDGRRIVTASYDTTALVWDAETGKQIGEPLKGHNAAVTSAAFSPDGNRIVTGSDDKTARLWVWDDDTKAYKSIAELKGHTDTVFSVAFSSGGERIVTASTDGTARVWGIFSDTGQFVAKAESEAPRCLTPAQRKNFFLDPRPPYWCIEEHKWPYQTQDWQAWLANTKLGKNPALPNELKE